MKWSEAKLARIKSLIRMGTAWSVITQKYGTSKSEILRGLRKYAPAFKCPAPNPVDKKVRQILLSLERGSSLQSVADQYGISKQGLQQRLKFLVPEFSLSSLRVRNREEKARKAAQAKTQTNLHRYGRPTFAYSSELERTLARKFRSLVYNARKRNLRVTIKLADIELPEFCPVLGMKLRYIPDSTGKRCDDTASFDRVRQDLGYVPGNVIVVSWRANRIRNDGTWEEHLQIAKFYKKLASDA